MNYQSGNLGGRFAHIVTLSKRNLIALLSKINDKDSHRTLLREVANGEILVVKIEDDVNHYGDRTPGSMSDRTERDIINFRSPIT